MAISERCLDPLLCSGDDFQILCGVITDMLITTLMEARVASTPNTLIHPPPENTNKRGWGCRGDHTNTVP